MASLVQQADTGLSRVLSFSGKPGDSSEREHAIRVPMLRQMREIQRRACIIHQRHGAWSGGYNLDDWLEAEHELAEEQKAPRKERTH